MVLHIQLRQIGSRQREQCEQKPEGMEENRRPVRRGLWEGISLFGTKQIKMCGVSETEEAMSDSSEL